MKNLFFILAAFFLYTGTALSQEAGKEEKPPVNKEKPAETAAKKTAEYKYDALAPSKAAFYSAVVPGLGQIYNKKYWKAPIVWGALGVSLYSYGWNQKYYKKYRNAYKQLLSGHALTGELEGIDGDRLIRAQKYYQRNRDLSALVTAGIYILNIVDANVDAHLRQFNVNENLSLRPDFETNDIDNQYHLGLTMSFRF